MKHIRLFLSVLILMLMFVPIHAQRADTKNIDANFYYRLQSGAAASDDLGFLTALEGWSQPALAQKLESPGQLWRIEYMGSNHYRVTNGLLKDQSLGVRHELDPYARSLSLSKTTSDAVIEALDPRGATALRGQLWDIRLYGEGNEDDCFTLSNAWMGGLLEATTDDDVNKRLSTTLGAKAESHLWVLEKTAVAVERGFELTSTSFGNRSVIPDKYTGENGVSPPLAWKGAPAGTKSFMLICTDPDAPSPFKPDPTPFIHWFMLNIPADTKFLMPGVPQLEQVSTPFGAVQAANGHGEIGYSGPTPPKGSGRHRYYFTLFALDRVHVLDPNLNPEEFIKILDSSVLAKAQLMGTYEVP